MDLGFKLRYFTKKTATILTHTLNLVKGASIMSEKEPDSFLGILNNLKKEYNNTYLKDYINTLDLFQNSIQLITRQLREYSGCNKGLFYFIKCSFVRTKLKIMLKYICRR